MSHAPNIVLIVADDHGREALGCYGNPVVRTPNLDALAAGGVRFTNAFCTTASCAGDPRHAALVQVFADKVRRFQEQTQDPWLHKWTYE